MELYKGEYSNRVNLINKFLLNCENPYERNKFYKLINLFYKSNNKQIKILNELYDNYKDIVLKISFIDSIKKEYNFAFQLTELPNFIKYHYIFESNNTEENILCFNDIKNIINNNFIRLDYKEEPIGLLIMNYYKLGSIGKYEWNEYNFNILKNVLTQVAFAILYAYEKTKFIHNDLHIDNIVLKPKSVNNINYGDCDLPIDVYEVIIMDFEKSTINNKENKLMYIISDLRKLLNNVLYMSKSNITIVYNELKLTTLIKGVFNKKYYNIIKDIIDTMEIEYINEI